MKKHFEYTNQDLDIFEGFYESNLYNGEDEQIQIDKKREDNYEGDGEIKDYEITDFKAFSTSVAKRIVDEWLAPLLTDYRRDTELCDRMELKEVHSPRQYNFTTDKLVCDLNIDLDLLAKRINDDEGMRNGFDAYLKEHYTTRSGFISWVPNNVNEYFAKGEDYEVMVDYYLLTKIFGTTDVVKVQTEYTQEEHDYYWAKIDIAREEMYTHLQEVKIS